MSDNNVLINAIQLNDLLNKSFDEQLVDGSAVRVLVLDCRHDLMDHTAGKTAFDLAHIPSAQFWNMETDAVAIHTGQNGRHPLATRALTRDCFAAFGLSNNTALVVYDGHGGQYAGRLWWLARWIGHPDVRLLDGGIQAWQAAGFKLASNSGADNIQAPEVKAPAVKAQAVKAQQIQTPSAKHEALHLRPSLVSWVDKQQVALTIKNRSSQVLDARASARFRGETEPLDPVAGHIPTAINRFYQENLTSAGLFKSKADLKTELDSILKGRAPAEVIHQCGSGVTACHNLIAMEIAGLSGSALYPGSWSEWCADLTLPVGKDK